MSHQGHAEVIIKDTCINGGLDGIVMHAQVFENTPNILWFWVLLPKWNPNVPMWYKEDCLTVVKGELPKDNANAWPHKIQKGSNVAYFHINTATKNVLTAAGFEVSKK